MKDTLRSVWNTRPLIISGPCSAETELQLMDTATKLAATGKINMIRAGIWKPRTKPGLFEGVGTVGLSWLTSARKQTGLPICVEVANAKHVEEALEFDVDVLWIGARTTVNPFSVQELADSLKGVDKPILVKNPMNPDLELWAGAIERLQKAGLNDIGLIHRGFSSFGNTEYRNAPMWQLPIEMKRRYPELLMICDPSHICGNRHLLNNIAQKSIDLGFGGLMIESHNNPDQAWSDSKQQITPENLEALLDNLIWRKEETIVSTFNNALTHLRGQIDQIDDELLQLLAQRMNVVDQIGEYKKENNVTILQTKRWDEIMQRAYSKCEQLGLNTDFIKKYYDALHMESISHQNKVMNR